MRLRNVTSSSISICTWSNFIIASPASPAPGLFAFPGIVSTVPNGYRTQPDQNTGQENVSRKTFPEATKNASGVFAPSSSWIKFAETWSISAVKCSIICIPHLNVIFILNITALVILWWLNLRKQPSIGIIEARCGCSLRDYVFWVQHFDYPHKLSNAITWNLHGTTALYLFLLAVRSSDPSFTCFKALRRGKLIYLNYANIVFLIEQSQNKDACLLAK